MGRRKSKSKNKKAENTGKEYNKKRFLLKTDLETSTMRLVEALAQGAEKETIEELRKRKKKTEEKIKESGFDREKMKEDFSSIAKRRIKRAKRAREALK